MADRRDNQMSRGLNQALYKYLPDSWIDFYFSQSRESYIAKVKQWNSRELKGINESRLLKAVAESVESFKNVKGFGPEINTETYDVLIPKMGNMPDIQAEISPLVFYCSNPKCSKVHSFTNSEIFLRNRNNRKCKKCNSNLKQLQFTYQCKCGWAAPVSSISCKDKEHGYETMKLGEYKFVCGTCGKPREMIKTCPECATKLFPKNALDWGQFIPFNFSLIDLVNDKEEDFLYNNDMGAKLIIAFWLGIITKEQLNRYVSEEVKKIDDVEYARELNEEIAKLIVLHIPEQYARAAAESIMKEKYGKEDVEKILNEVQALLNNLDEKYLKKLATSILEYNTILHSDNVSNLDDAINMARKLNTNSSPEKYKEIARKYGIHHTQVSGKVPFINCSYGYTRRKQEGEGVYLRAFPKERNEKKNVYATKLDTEGVLFEFDRKMIVEWLYRNKYISDVEMPSNLDDDRELKSWFINHVNIDAISKFDAIDKDIYPITHHVYNLIHSMSHAYIRQAAQLCGLDKNSLSEYIFPSIPSVFIYCQNSQGFNLGALFNIFEAYFDKWLTSTLMESEKCIFDPICLDRDKACVGCLLLNEVSCAHFNKDLNRRYLVGWFDKVQKKRTFGFWEGI